MVNLKIQYGDDRKLCSVRLLLCYPFFLHMFMPFFSNCPCCIFPFHCTCHNSLSDWPVSSYFAPPSNHASKAKGVSFFLLEEFQSTLHHSSLRLLVAAGCCYLYMSQVYCTSQCSYIIKLVGRFIGFYGISTFVGYLTPNLFLCK